MHRSLIQSCLVALMVGTFATAMAVPGKLGEGDKVVDGVLQGVQEGTEGDEQPYTVTGAGGSGEGSGSGSNNNQSTGEDTSRPPLLNCAGQHYTGPSGGVWCIAYNKNVMAGPFLEDISPYGVSFEKCINTCGNHPSKCVRVAWSAQPGDGGRNCFLLGNKNGNLHHAPGVKVATKSN